MSPSVLIKLARKQRGISQQVLADLLGMSVRSLGRIETGEIIPDDLQATTIAEYLRLDISTLISLCEAERGICEYVNKSSRTSSI